MKLREKISIFLLATSLLTVGISFLLVQSSAEKTLRDNYFANLTAIRSIKTNQIVDHFDSLKTEVSSLATNPYTVIATSDLTKAFAKLNYLDKVVLKEHPKHEDADDNDALHVHEEISDTELLTLAEENETEALHKYHQVIDAYDDYLTE